MINTTNEYHIHGMSSLGWELTICNALQPYKSPCRKILRYDDSYGNILYDYLRKKIPMEETRRVIEVGGGYGYLMRDFLKKNHAMQASMLEISPHLLEKQKELLRNFDVNYILGDFLDAEISFLRGFDMAIFNENLGDFPTAVNISRDIFNRHSNDMQDSLKRIRKIFDRYNLAKPEVEIFNFNIGAIEVMEKLCSSCIPHIFLCEHSCEALAPSHYLPYLQISSSGNPEKIALYGHDEYTIKFSYLQKIASTSGYKAIRGPVADFIEVKKTDKISTILRSHFAVNDEYEIIRHFIEDLYQYEYLILVREG